MRKFFYIYVFVFSLIISSFGFWLFDSLHSSNRWESPELIFMFFIPFVFGILGFIFSKKDHYLEAFSCIFVSSVGVSVSMFFFSIISFLHLFPF